MSLLGHSHSLKIPMETSRISDSEDLISTWLAEGYLERWTPRLQELDGYTAGHDGPATGTTMSFFDVLTAQELYVSPGGMRNLCVTWVSGSIGEVGSERYQTSGDT